MRWPEPSARSFPDKPVSGELAGHPMKVYVSSAGNNETGPAAKTHGLPRHDTFHGTFPAPPGQSEQLLGRGSDAAGAPAGKWTASISSANAASRYGLMWAVLFLGDPGAGLQRDGRRECRTFRSWPAWKDTLGAVQKNSMPGRRDRRGRHCEGADRKENRLCGRATCSRRRAAVADPVSSPGP